MATKKSTGADVTPDSDSTIEIDSADVTEPTAIFDTEPLGAEPLGTERLDTAQPEHVAPTSVPEGRRPMRGTAIAWGIILLLVAAIGWFVGTVDLWKTSTEQILATVIVVGAVLVGVGILGAIIRAVSKR